MIYWVLCHVAILISTCVLAAPELPTLVLPPTPATNFTSQILRLPSNSTCGNGIILSSDRSTNLPPDPYYYHVPGTNINVNIRRIGDPLEYSCVQLCLSKATRDITLRTGGDLSKTIISTNRHGCKVPTSMLTVFFISPNSLRMRLFPVTTWPTHLRGEQFIYTNLLWRDRANLMLQ